MFEINFRSTRFLRSSVRPVIQLTTTTTTNTSDGDKDNPPDPPDVKVTNTNTDAQSIDTPAVHSANNDSLSTDIAQDLSYNSNYNDFDSDFADDIADANMLDPKDVPVPPGTNYHDDDHMTDTISATGTPSPPPDTATRLFYSTDSEWDSSPWSTVSY